MSIATATQPLNTDQAKAKSQEICNKFREIGLMAVVPARAPLGPNVFSMGLDPNGEVYRFWAGNASVEIVDVKSEPKPQAVVRVSEQKHKVEMSFQREVFKHSHKAVLVDTPRNYSTATFPAGTTFAFKKDPIWKSHRSKITPNDGWGKLTGVVVAEVPAFDNSFLMGYDEVKCFISQLPKHVKTIEEAHKALRPTNILKTSVRQGEWFFTPCSKAEISTIEKEIARMGKIVENSNSGREAARERSRHRSRYNSAINTVFRNRVPITGSSSHRVLRRVEIGKTVYVKGYVIDSRSGHHAKLVLEDWHRVTRNNEVIEHRAAPEFVRRNWD